MTDPTPLKYSDYATGAAILTGIVGTSIYLEAAHPTLVAYALIATTALTAISQWLQSKGD